MSPEVPCLERCLLGIDPSTSVPNSCNDARYFGVQGNLASVQTSCDFTFGEQESGLLCAKYRQESTLSSPYH